MQTTDALKHAPLLALTVILLLIGCAPATPAAAPSGSGEGQSKGAPNASRNGAVVTVPSAGPGSTEAAKPVEEAASAPSVPAKLPVTAADPTWGSPDALVTIVEFGDFECPFCARAVETLKRVREHYGPRDVRIVWKNQVLPFHKNAMPAHRAAMAVYSLAGPEAFWVFHDRAFENRRALTEENFVRWADEAGVSRSRFLLAYEDPAQRAKIDADIKLAAQVGATGTPAFRINGVTLSGAQPFDKFKSLIDEQLALARAKADEGMPRSEISIVLTNRNLDATAAQQKEERARKNRDEPSKPDPDTAEPDTTVWKVPVLPSDPVRGSRDAAVTIVEFGDFQCPFCKRVQPTLLQLLQDYGSALRIVWKDNPLEFHEQADAAANLARHIAKHRGPDAFWAAHDLLFQHQKDFDGSAFEDISKSFGLPWNASKIAITQKRYEKLIRETREQATDLEARGVPHFFINGRRLSGAQPIEKFKELIDEQVKVAAALEVSGVPREQIYDRLMRDAKTPEGPEKRKAPVVGSDMPSRGNAKAKVVIQAFMDFQCPFCSRAQATLDGLMKKYPGKVRIVYRHNPLPFHKHAKLAAEASVEAFKQRGNRGFWKFHDLLFQNQTALTRDSLEKYAQKVGLDMVRFRKALDDGIHRQQVEADMQVAQDIEIRGTPAFMVNDFFMAGALPPAEFERRIDLALRELSRP